MDIGLLPHEHSDLEGDSLILEASEDCVKLVTYVHSVELLTLTEPQTTCIMDYFLTLAYV